MVHKLVYTSFLFCLIMVIIDGIQCAPYQTPVHGQSTWKGIQKYDTEIIPY